MISINERKDKVLKKIVEMVFIWCTPDNKGHNYDLWVIFCRNFDRRSNMRITGVKMGFVGTLIGALKYKK